MAIPNVRKDLATGVCRTEFEIDAAEYYAIGRVTAQWAYLEHGVYAITKAISDNVGIALPSDALSTAFKRRLNALRLLVEKYASADEKKRMTSLIGKIANAEQDRHKITHAMWEWDRSDSERISASSFRLRFEFEKQYDARKMNELADRIGEISFALEYPDGWEAAFREMLEEHADEDGNVAFFHISRQLHREWISHRDRGQQGSDQATPPEGMRRPPSSGK